MKKRSYFLKLIIKIRWYLSRVNSRKKEDVCVIGHLDKPYNYRDRML